MFTVCIKALIACRRVSFFFEEPGFRIASYDHDSLTDQKNWRIGAMVFYLRAPLGRHILEGGRADYGEADEEDVRLRVRQRPQAIVVLLPSCVPQSQGYGHAVAHLR